MGAKSCPPTPEHPLAGVALGTLYALGGLLGISLGILNPIVAIFMEERHVDGVLIGANASLLFLCVALAAPFAGRALRRIGLRRVVAVGLLAYATAAVSFPWQSDIGLWFALRGLMGLGMACAMIGTQTALSCFAGEERRAVANGVYGLCFGIGLAVGPVVGSYLYGLAHHLPFTVATVLLVQAAVLVAIGLPGARAEPERASGRLLLRAGIPVQAVLAYGFAEATLLTLYPAVLVRQGFTAMATAHHLAAFVLGGLLGTLPVSHLGDRLGYRRVLFGCGMGGIVALAVLMRVDSVSALIGDVWVRLGQEGQPISAEYVAGGAAFATGLTLGPVFALALALLARILPRADLPGGTALFTAAFAVGSAGGPWLSAWIMPHGGGQHLFTPSMALFGMLVFSQAVSWLWRWLRSFASDYAIDTR
jgi:MFS family permease